MQKLPNVIYPLVNSFVEVKSNTNKSINLTSTEKWHLVKDWLKTLSTEEKFLRPGDKQINILYQIYNKRINSLPDQNLVELAIQNYLSYIPFIEIYIKNKSKEFIYELADISLNYGNLLVWEFINSKLDQLGPPERTHSSYFLHLLTTEQYDSITVESKYIITALIYYVQYYKLTSDQMERLLKLTNSGVVEHIDVRLLYYAWLQENKYLINTMIEYLNDIWYDEGIYLFSDYSNNTIDILDYPNGVDFILDLMSKVYKPSEYDQGLVILSKITDLKYLDLIKDIIYDKFHLKDQIDHKTEEFLFFVGLIPFEIYREKITIFEIFRCDKLGYNIIDYILVDWINTNLNLIGDDDIDSLVLILHQYICDLKIFLDYALEIIKNNELFDKIAEKIKAG